MDLMVYLKNNALCILLSLFLIGIIIRSVFYRVEQFSEWDDYMTQKVTGESWKYDGPTTRIEYDFRMKDPETDVETRISPITWNSFPDGTMCENS